MRFSLADTMDVVASSADTSLVTREAWREVRDAADRMPATVVTGVYLECRLADHAPLVDWIVRVEPDRLATLCDRTVASDACWAPIARLSAHIQAEPILGRVVRHLWLEFDDSEPRPSVFVCLDSTIAGDLSIDDGVWLVDRLMCALTPDLATASRRAAVRRAFEQRPVGATIPYLGVLASRVPQAVRVYVAGVAAPAIASSLGRMGWPGDPMELDEIVNAFDGPAIGMWHLDIDDGVLPRVGMEYTLARPPQIRGAIHERAFLQRVVERRLCTEAKLQGLLAWPGRAVTTLPHELWRSIVVRRVNCLKLVHTPGQPLEGKAYLLARWAPLHRAAIRDP